MKKEIINKFTQEEIKKGKILSILSYLWIVAFVTFLTSNNKYVLFHSKQAIRLTMIYTPILIVLLLLNKIQSLWIITDKLIPITILFAISLSLFGIIDALKGKAKELPIINKIFELKRG
jgi:uncharacterized membrane protein